MATPERTARRTKRDPLLQFPQRQWVLSGVKMDEKQRRGCLILPWKWMTENNWYNGLQHSLSENQRIHLEDEQSLKYEVNNTIQRLVQFLKNLSHSYNHSNMHCCIHTVFFQKKKNDDTYFSSCSLKKSLIFSINTMILNKDMVRKKKLPDALLHFYSSLYPSMWQITQTKINKMLCYTMSFHTYFPFKSDSLELAIFSSPYTLFLTHV